MKKLVYSLSLTVLTLANAYNSTAQTVVYSEDFEGAITWALNTDATAEDAFPSLAVNKGHHVR